MQMEERKGPASARTLRDRGPQQKGRTVDKRSVAEARSPGEADGKEHRGCVACYLGVVYIGHVQDENGEEVEVTETIPCRRCQSDRRA
jgi:hypothetical protein